MLKDLIAVTEPIHTREISLSSHVHEEAGLIVHGILKDRRRVPIVDILGRPKGPGIIHHITVTLALEKDPLRIVKAEAQMITVPTEYCAPTLDRLPNLEGLEIKSGFSLRVKEAIGGPEGCIHLCSLVTAMGTEMVHGWLTEKRSKSPQGTMDIDAVKENMFLIDSCRVWKKDGPRVRDIKKAMETRLSPQ